jgi:short subunit dehydrogenase-like uncharacterized protein
VNWSSWEHSRVILPDETLQVVAFGKALVVTRIDRAVENGMIEEVPLAHYWRRIDFAGGSAMAIAIPWGDLATAGFSTDIPNIETYAAVPRAAAYASRALNWVRPLLASARGQVLLRQPPCMTSPTPTPFVWFVAGLMRPRI